MMPDFVTDILTPIQERVTYRKGMAVKLAGIIAGLLNEHESLLKAEHDGTEIIVTEKGGPLVFTISVDPGMLGTRVMRERNQLNRGSGVANNAPDNNQ